MCAQVYFLGKLFEAYFLVVMFLNIGVDGVEANKVLIVVFRFDIEVFFLQACGVQVKQIHIVIPYKPKAAFNNCFRRFHQDARIVGLRACLRTNCPLDQAHS